MPLLTIQGSQHESVTPDIYNAVFKAFESLETEKGAAYRWSFTISEGPNKDRVISEISDANNAPTTKNKTGRFLVAISGKPLEAGVSVDPDHYIGKKYMVVTEAKDGGGSKIVTFSPAG